MSSIPTNIPPVAISSQKNKNGRCKDARQVKVSQTSNQKKRKSNKEFDFPMGKEVFNDPYSLADEKYRLLVDISVLQNEVEPLRSELDHLKYFIKRTQDSNELKQAEQLEALDQEYDKLCIRYDNLDNLYSDVVLEQNQKHFEIMKQRQKVLILDLEDAEKALLSLESEFAQPRIAKYEKKYTQNETKIAELKKVLKDLKKEEKELNIQVTNSFSKSSSEDKNEELNRLTNNYNSLKVISLNKKHELEFMEKSFNARADRIRQRIQTKKNENEEKEERRQFNSKMKKKKEDHFLFDSYMKSKDMKNIHEPDEIEDNEQKNPRGKNRQQNSKSEKSESLKARKTQKFILKVDTNNENSDHLSTDNFESFTSPCQSPVSTQNIENGFDGTKTFGTDDFNSTNEFSNSRSNLTKSLQSELGSDEEGDLNAISKSATSALSDNSIKNKKNDDETENETEKQEKSETENETEKQEQDETENTTETQQQTETEKQEKNENENTTETQNRSETENHEQTETENDTEKQEQDETENTTETQQQTETETEKQEKSENENTTETQNQSETENNEQNETENSTETQNQTEAEMETEKQEKSENESNGGTTVKKQNESNEDDDIISNSMAETESGVTPPHSPLAQQMSNAIGLLANNKNK